MAISQAFNIVSHFKFEVGGALTQSSALGTNIKKLSEQAGALNERLKFTTVGWATQLTGAQFGVLGFFKNILKSSEETYDIQRRMATLITNNPKKFAEGPLKFQDAMKVSKSIMKDIVKDSDKFALNTWDYFYKIEGLNAQLFKEGVTGVNFGETRKLARNIMLGRELLPGLDNIDLQNSMLRIIGGGEGGGAQKGQILWDKLRGDTDTFKHISAPAFNVLSAKRRVELLNKAYEELTKNEDARLARLKTLSAQLTRLNNRFTGVMNIFTKMGNVLRVFVLDNLKQIIKYVDDQVAPAFDSLAGILKHLISGKTLVDLHFQIKELATLGKSVDVAHTLAVITFGIKELIGLSLAFGPVRRVLGAGLKFLGISVLASVTGLARLGKVLMSFSKVFVFLFRAVGHYAKFWAVAFTISRIWEKAKIVGDKMDVQALGKNVSNISQLGLKLTEVIIALKTPFSWFADKVGNLIGPLTSTSWWIENLGKLLGELYGTRLNTTADSVNFLNIKLKQLGETILTITAGIVAGLTHLLPYMGATGGGFAGMSAGPVGGMVGAMAGWKTGDLLRQKIYDRYDAKDYPSLQYKILQEFQSMRDKIKEDSEVPQSVTNIGKVEIRNQFAENFDPDRVAVTIIEGLNKASNNKLGSLNNNPLKTVGLTQRIR